MFDGVQTATEIQTTKTPNSTVLEQTHQAVEVRLETMEGETTDVMVALAQVHTTEDSLGAAILTNIMGAVQEVLVLV